MHRKHIASQLRHWRRHSGALVRAGCGINVLMHAKPVRASCGTADGSASCEPAAAEHRVSSGTNGEPVAIWRYFVLTHCNPTALIVLLRAQHTVRPWCGTGTTLLHILIRASCVTGAEFAVVTPCNPAAYLGVATQATIEHVPAAH